MFTLGIMGGVIMVEVVLIIIAVVCAVLALWLLIKDLGDKD